MKQRINRLYPWLNKANQNKTMQTKLLNQLERIKLLSYKEEKVVINSWDITYQENIKKYEKRKARFVDDGVDEQRMPTPELQKMTPAVKKRRGTLVEKAKTENLTNVSSITLTNGMAMSPNQARRMQGIVIEDLDPDRLIFSDPKDGDKLVTAPFI